MTATSDIEVAGYSPAPGEQMTVSTPAVAPDYFETLRIPVLQGRDFTDRDNRGSPFVAIVNQAFAQRYFGGANPLGRKVRVAGNWTTVIGEVKDSKYRRLTEPPTPYLFEPYRQWNGGEFWMAFFIRTVGPSSGMIQAVRHEAAAVAPDAAVAEVVPYEEEIGGTLYGQKVAAALLSVLGAVAVLLAALGLYGVLAYTVSQRQHEFGIRMALGAAPGDVVGLVLRRGMLLTVAGVAGGVVLALLAAPLASGFLIGVSPGDPVAFAGAALFLAAVALAASYLPARRATKVDPMVALREP
jgi:predicted permease